MHCSDCGVEVSPSASYCESCGADLSDDSADTDAAAETSPVWSLAALGLAWLLFAGYLATSSSALLIPGGLSVLASIPILWLDARGAIRAGELEVSRPIYVVIAVYLLYALTMPVYLLFRVYRRRGAEETSSTAAA